jgi:hypothetical protein
MGKLVELSETSEKIMDGDVAFGDGMFPAIWAGCLSHFSLPSHGWNAENFIFPMNLLEKKTGG